jgi:hypothetical protein
MIATVQPPMLKVTNFLFKMSTLLLEYSASQENRGWVEVLHPDHIHCIHIDIMINKPPPTIMPVSVADYSQVDLNSLYQHVTMIVLHPTALQELAITGQGGLRIIMHYSEWGGIQPRLTELFGGKILSINRPYLSVLEGT